MGRRASDAAQSSPMGVDGRGGVMRDRARRRREALAWRDRGYSVEWVAARLGLPRRTVRRWFG